MRFCIKRICLFLALVSVPFGLRADYKDDIGYTALALELGNLSITPPNGTGVTVSQVEADFDGVGGSPYVYMPDTSDPQFSSDTITDVNGLSSGPSSHASMVGGLIYGSNSIASGINSVGGYLADAWLGSSVLRYANSSVTPSPLRFSAPVVESRDVQNHSWVGSTAIAAQDTIILRRLDFAIQRDDFVAVVGVNNGVSQEQNLLSSAYNVISVGVSSGNHSYGDTTINGAGRAVPQIVVPVATTSEATAIVSAASALVIQQARTMGSSNGEKSETVKAVLLAGATKGEFTTWSNSSSQPLDAIYGAGGLNVQNNYHIMAASEQNASGSSDVGSTGWDFGSVNSSSTQSYYLVLTQASNLTIALDWNAIVQATGGDYDNTTLSLANLDLRLFEASGYTPGSLVGESLSTVDNIEYLWELSLNPGRYVIQVSSGSATLSEFALAWQAVVIPEPSTWSLLFLAGGVVLIFFVRKKKV